MSESSGFGGFQVVSSFPPGTYFTFLRLRVANARGNHILGVGTAVDRNRGGIAFDGSSQQHAAEGEHQEVLEGQHLEEVDVVRVLSGGVV